MTVQGVMNAIYNRLATDTGAGGVHTLTGGRIFDTVGAQGAELPLVVMQLVTMNVDGRFLEDGAEGELQIDVYGNRASGPAEARTIAERCKTRLHRNVVTGSDAPRVGILMIGDAISEWDDEAIRIIQRYRLFCSP